MFLSIKRIYFNCLKFDYIKVNTRTLPIVLHTTAEQSEYAIAYSIFSHSQQLWYGLQHLHLIHRWHLGFFIDPPRICICVWKVGDVSVTTSPTNPRLWYKNFRHWFLFFYCFTEPLKNMSEILKSLL